MVYQYHRKILADSPVSYWRLSEAATPTDLTTRPVAIDQMGANNGSYIGGNWQAEALADSPVSLWRLNEAATPGDYARNRYLATVQADSPVSVWRLGEAASPADSTTRPVTTDAQGANAGAYVGANWEAEVIADTPVSLWKLGEGTPSAADSLTRPVAADVQSANAGGYVGANWEAEVVADSPVSLWKLAEASGTAAADVQGANAGTYLLPGGTFDNDLTGWTSANDSAYFDSGTAVLSVSTASPHSGAGCMKVVSTTNSYTGARIPLGNVTWPSGVQQTVTVWMKGNAGGESVQIMLGPQGGGTTGNTICTLTTSWQQFSATFTPGSTITAPEFVIRTNATNGITWFVDDVVLSSGFGAALGQSGPLTNNTDTAVLLDGASGYVTIPASVGLNLTTLTVETWVKPAGNGTYAVVSNMLNNADRGWSLAVQNNKGFLNLCQTVSNNIFFGTANSIPTGQWTHIAFTFSGGTLHTYINGAEVSFSGSAPASIGYTTQDPAIGRNPANGGSQYLNGAVFGAAVYNTVLSAQRIQTHYTAGKQTALTFAQTGPLTNNTDTGVLLDGTTAYATVGLQQPTTFSVEAWVKFATSGDQGIFSFESGGFSTANTSAALAVATSRHWFVAADFGGSSWVDTGVVAPVAGAYHHVAVTYNGTTTTLYVDGISVWSGAQAVTTRRTAFFAGVTHYNTGNDRYLNGTMFGVAVTPSALSAQRILTHYTAGKQTALTFSQTGALFGDPDTALKLDGAAGNVLTTYNPFVGTTSFEGWAYSTSNPANGTLFGGTNPSSNPFLYFHGATNLQFSPDSVAACEWTNVWPGNNQWVHWVLVWDNGAKQATLYINGVSQGTVTASPANAYPGSPGNFQIGAMRGGSLFFPGLLDEVAVYNYALSAARVLAHYNAGTMGRPVANDVQGAHNGVYVGANWEAEVLADDPISIWELSESSGTTAADLQGTNNGTYNLGNQSTFSDSLATNTLASYSTVRGTAFVQGGGGFQSQVVNGDNFFVRTDNGFYNGAVTVKIAIGSTVPNIAAVLALTDNSHWLIAYIDSINQLGLEVDNGGVISNPTTAFTPQPNTTYWIRVDRNGSNATATVYSSDPALGASPLATASLTGDSNVGALGQLRPGMYANVANAAGQVHTYNNLTLSPNSGSNSLGQSGPLSGNTDTAVQLDGLSGYVNVPNSASLNLTGQCTVELWVNPNTAALSGDCILIERSPSESIYIQLHNGVPQGGGAQTATSTLGALTAGTWYLFTLIYDGSVWKLYQNGVLAGTSAASAAPASNTNPWFFGQHASNLFFKGALFGAAVYNTALSAQRILTHYKAGLQTSLTLGQSGPLVNNSDTTMLLDGSTGYAIIPTASGLQPTASGTWSGWINYQTGKQATLVNYVNVSGVRVGPLIEVTTVGQLFVYIAGTSSPQINGTNGEITAGWHYVEVTYDGSNIRRYVDGVLLGSAQASTGSVTYTGCTNVWIGRDASVYSAATFFGVAVDGSALSAQRIKTHYTAGKQTALTFRAPGALTTSGDSDTAVTADGATGYVSTTYSPFVSGGTQTFEGWATRTDSAQFQSLVGGTGAAAPLLCLLTGTRNVQWYPSNSLAIAWNNTWPVGSSYVYWAFVWNDSTKVGELFINGVSQGQRTHTQAYTAAGNLLVGTSVAGNSWNGSQDEVAVYNYALSAAQILEHYTLGASVM